MTDPAGNPHHPLQKIFGERLFSDALQLIDSGGVFNFNVLQAGSVVTGVTGAEANGNARHRVYIRQAGAGNDERRIDGECSCGANGHCIHIAAIAIAAARSAGGTATDHRASVAADRQPAAAIPAARAQRQQLCYLVESPGLRLSLWVAQITVHSGRTRADNICRFVPRFANGASELPRYVDALDRDILQRLTAQRYESPWTLAGDSGAVLFQQVVSTGRAFWQSVTGQPLKSGDIRDVRFDWQALPNGDQRLRSHDAISLHVMLDVDPPLYVDAASNECGHVRLPYPAQVLRDHWHRAAVAPEQVTAVNEELALDATAAHFPRLRTLPIHRQALSSLHMKLVLSAGPAATPHFVYNGVVADTLSLRPGQTTVRCLGVSDGTEVLYETDRDPAAEQALQSRLERTLSAARHDCQSWLTFMMQSVPALQSEGWDIEAREDFPYRIAVANQWYADLDTRRDGRRDGWFDLRLGVVVDGITSTCCRRWLPICRQPGIAVILRASASAITC